MAIVFPPVNSGGASVASLSAIQIDLDALQLVADKIDDAAVDGLSGTKNSLAYKVHEIEKHFHGREYWYGKDSADTFFNATSATAWQMASSATINTFGPSIQLSNGDEIESGDPTKYYDLHRIYVKAASVQDKVYRIMFTYATGGTAGQAAVLTETLYVKADNKIDSSPVEIQGPRIACNNKLWGQVACETGSGTIDILVGLHIYAG